MKDNTNKQIATWLYCGAVCIFIQILLGGITRLTGSGLSITEWQPLLGFLPPSNEAEWQHSFDQYKHIAQFKRVNAHFTLTDYQAIFFWEWFHRNWARLIGLVFIIPLVFFLVTKKIKATLLIRLILLFLLGALQAVIGWIMVKSGLNDSYIAVNEVKLAIHLVTACLLLAATLWLAFKRSIPTRIANYSYKLKGITAILLGLVLIQLFYGALMAGSKAALAAPTWPDMNGYLLPPEILSSSSDAGQSHLLTVQLIHRSLAYLIAILVFVLYKNVMVVLKMNAVSKTHQFSSLLYHMPPALVLLQIMLGIITLLNSFISSYWVYALLHQGVGLLLFSSILYIFYLCHKKSIS
jgi:cytochrome c oxidase assembly protein subunit 15